MSPDSGIVQDAGHLLFRVQKAALERLFPVGWLTSAPSDHPARIRWELCRRMIAQNGRIRIPDQLSDLPLIGRVILDAFLLSQLAGNDWVGPLNGLGDARVQAKIRTRVLDPGQFEDVLAELTLAGWYRSGKHNAQPLETPGLPDIRVDSAALDRPLFVECKRLWSLARNRLVSEVRDANRQLRNVDASHYGLAYFDASNAVGVVDAEPEHVPEQLVNALRILSSTVSNEHNKSVQALVVSWDMYHVVPTDSGSILILFVRAAHRFDHIPVGECVALPAGSPVFNGISLALVFGTTAERSGGEEAEISQAFREQFGTPLGISDDQFVQVIRHPDQRQPVGRIDQRYLTLYTHVFTCDRDWLMVLIGALSDGRKSELLWVFPVPPELQYRLDGALPIHTLAGLADTYGCSFSIGERRTRFVFGERIRITPSDPLELMHQIDVPPGATVVPYFVGAYEEAPETTIQCGMAFVMNMSGILNDIPTVWRAA